jgi:transposase InsO family protein
VIIDIFSRRVVGWRLAAAETAALFKPLFDDAAAAKQGVKPGQLTLHADRGPSMRPRPPPCCSPIWASPNHTTGPILPMTIRSRKPQA